MFTKSIRMSVLLVMVIVVAACGGNGAPGSTNAPGATNPPGGTSSPTTPSPTSPPPTDASGDKGGGTLTIGSETWELFAFRCAIGEDETRSVDYPFSSRGAVALPGGTELSITLEVLDLNEEGRLSGDDVFIDEFFVRETGDNPTIDWRTDGWVPGWGGSLSLGDQDSRKPLVTSFTVDENARTISVQATFVNMMAGEPGDYPDSAFVEGSFQGQCGPG